MERILRAQESLKRAVEAERLAMIALEEAKKARFDAQKTLDETKQLFLEENKMASNNRKTSFRIWTDNKGEQHKIEYFVV